MRKYSASIFATTILALLLAGCVSSPTSPSPSPFAHASSSSQTSPSAEVSASASPSVDIPKTTSSEFDPYNPEGWKVSYDDGLASYISNNKLLISDSDYSIGDFDLLMTVNEAAKHFPSKPLTDTKKEYYGFLTEETMTFDSLTLVFSREDDTPYALSSVETTSPNYVTPRGLRVGDDVAKLFKLYGVPLRVENNEWTFGDRDSEHLSVTVVGGSTKKIYLFNEM